MFDFAPLTVLLVIVGIILFVVSTLVSDIAGGVALGLSVANQAGVEYARTKQPPVPAPTDRIDTGLPEGDL